MRRIPIMQARPGMTLDRDIRRPDTVDGPPICGKGLELTWSLIDRLRRMGIQTISVTGYGTGDEAVKTRQQLLDELDRRFRKVGDDPLCGKLKSIYKAYLLREPGE